MSIPQLRDGDALLIVDVQNDFCPEGALPIPDGDHPVPVLNEWIAAAGRAGIPIYASRDWHPRGHPSFDSEGGPWPAHCLQDTEGAAFHPGLHLPEDVVVVTKGTRFDRDQYSAFDETAGCTTGSGRMECGASGRAVSPRTSACARRCWTRVGTATRSI
jgi:nicotinamidase/pyrazinamidase